MLVWQQAMKKISMTTGSFEDPLSLTYPAQVAKDTLAYLSQASLDSIVAHGPGMEIKIFEIANTLLDVINCVPSLTFGDSMTQGPRDIFHGLSHLLGSLSGGQSRSLALLQGKIAELKTPFVSIPRFVEIHDQVETSPSSNDARSIHSPISPDFPLPREWRASPVSLPIVPKRSVSDDTVPRAWVQQVRAPSPLRLDHPELSTIQVPYLGLANGLAMDWPPYDPRA
jgi:hypothetical protein